MASKAYRRQGGLKDAALGAIMLHRKENADVYDALEAKEFYMAKDMKRNVLKGWHHQMVLVRYDF